VRFRAKLFLAVLIPASGLVAVSVAAALLEIQRSSERAVGGEFGRTQAAMGDLLEAERGFLRPLETTFKGVWFHEFVTKGASPAGRAELIKDRDLEYQFQDLQLKPDFFAATTADGAVWARRHADEACVETCAHAFEWPWPKGAREALFRVGNAPHLGWRIDFAVQGDFKGSVVIAKELTQDLGRLLKSLELELALIREGVVVYSSLAGWVPDPGLPESVRVRGARYLTSTRPAGEVAEMILLRPMGEVDEQRHRAVAGGVAGLLVAVLIAAGVSVRVSRGISRPVEALVEATRKVGAGDYAAQVDIRGRDEMARLGTAFNDMTEGLRKRREIMEKTLSRDVAEELMKGVELGGERREVTTLFLDVRGFTTATEGVDPAEVVPMLNDMMNFLAEAVARHGGNVNKFLGDGLMAMFGAPRDLPDHALCSIRAALDMQREMGGWNAKRSGRGLPPLHVGIGINTGVVLGGKVGSRNRLEYTLIGEEVNLASRVCGKAAPGQVLITKQTFERVRGRVAARELEPVQVKGLSYPVHVYEVTA